MSRGNISISSIDSSSHVLLICIQPVFDLIYLLALVYFLYLRSQNFYSDNSVDSENPAMCLTRAQVRELIMNLWNGTKVLKTSMISLKDDGGFDYPIT